MSDLEDAMNEYLSSVNEAWHRDEHRDKELRDTAISDSDLMLTSDPQMVRVIMGSYMAAAMTVTRISDMLPQDDALRHAVVASSEFAAALAASVSQSFLGSLLLNGYIVAKLNPS